MKTPMLESLLHKVVDLQGSNFIKKRRQHRRFHVANVLRNTYFEENLRRAASELTFRRNCLELCFKRHSFSKPYGLSNIRKIPVAFKPKL